MTFGPYRDSNAEKKFDIENWSREADLRYAGFIDGAFQEGAGASLIVENPSDESEVARFNGVSAAQVSAAIKAARKAYDSGVWSDRSAKDRAAILTRYMEALARKSAEITELVIAEAGCPRGASVMHAQVGTPLRQGAHVIDLFLQLPAFEENPLPLAERATPMGQYVQSIRRYTPIGVVAAIAAYNFPFYTALWKVMPALITGNTVVLRPSPLTPLSAMVFAEAAIEAELPPGVLNIVLDAGLEGGQLLTTHPDVDMVAFTGSSQVGALVMAQAAPTMKRLQLELGGKSAQIFFEDSVDRAAMMSMAVCVSHAGQGCALGTRVFVPESKKAQVLEQAAAAMQRLKLGPANDPQTQMGPVISAAQRARCEHYVDIATKAGAKVVTGGKRPAHLERGFFFEPTLLDVPDNSNLAAQDEIFGPVVSVIGYRDIDHAVAMANDSKFGLSGYVYGQDKTAAMNAAMRLKTGTVNVNGGAMSAYASSGGQRMSGIGRERGVEGIRLYQQLSCLNLGG